MKFSLDRECFMLAGLFILVIKKNYLLTVNVEMTMRFIINRFYKFFHSLVLVNQ